MADKLNINLRYCYGIGKLEAELEFKHKGYAIYAPNGVMKTSLAKTMMDLSEGNSPKDLHFPNREPTCEITLNGEGLQHQDGHSHLLASTVPNCVSYDPTYSYELAVILHDGLKRMYEDNEKVFYYLTLMNEN